MTLQSDLDAIAARQGKNIPPGNVIQGLGGAPPAFDAALPGDRYGTIPFPDEDLDEPGDEEEFRDARESAVPPSPLIPRMPAKEAVRKVAELQASTPGNLENFRVPDLTILGNEGMVTVAAYQGRQVELSTPEAAAVRRVVLQAIKRTITAQLDEVAALLPRRKRRRAGGGLTAKGQHGEGQPGSPGGFVASDVAGSPAPKKRGRPKKVQP